MSHAETDLCFTQNPLNSQNLPNATCRRIAIPIIDFVESAISAYSALIYNVLLLFRFFFNGLGEETEIHFAVMPLLHEMRMLLEVLVFVVLQHKHTVFFQQVVVENKLDQLIVMLAIVWRVGKDEVVFHLVGAKEAEDIGTDDE